MIYLSNESELFFASLWKVPFEICQGKKHKGHYSFVRLLLLSNRVALIGAITSTSAKEVMFSSEE